MTVKNKTRQTTIAKNLLTPTSLKDQSIGLISHKEPTAMLIKTRFGIHTLFMKYAIDVLILDEANNVVALKENLKPNDMYIWNPKYNKVLELPRGTIKKSKTKIADKMSISTS